MVFGQTILKIQNMMKFVPEHKMKKINFGLSNQKSFNGGKKVKHGAKNLENGLMGGQ